MAEKIKWYLVFSSEEIAEKNIPENRAVVVDLEGKKLCLTRTKQEYFAFEDKCPHQGAPMNKGKCEDGHFICPWHRYAFNLENGREKTGSGDVLHMYKTKVENGKVYVGIADKAPWWLAWLK
jgi:nitrite reductase/ring-hydroxylating ferredoxin subunit